MNPVLISRQSRCRPAIVLVFASSLAMGVRADRYVTEALRASRLRLYLGTWWLIVDIVVRRCPIQHAVNLMNDAERQKLSDTIKNVMQQPDWPVSFILSGIPTLSTFVTRDVQLMRRSRIFEFRNLDFAKDADQVRRTVEHMVNKHAEMKLAAALPDEFINRLFHATDARFGVLIQLLRGAIEQAMFDDASGGEVRSRHFAKAYGQFSGCEPDENVFVREDWHTIHPAAALIRNNPAIGEQTAPTRRRKRA